MAGVRLPSRKVTAFCAEGPHSPIWRLAPAAPLVAGMTGCDRLGLGYRNPAPPTGPSLRDRACALLAADVVRAIASVSHRAPNSTCPHTVIVSWSTLSLFAFFGRTHPFDEPPARAGHASRHAAGDRA